MTATLERLAAMEDRERQTAADVAVVRRDVAEITRELGALRAAVDRLADAALLADHDAERDRERAAAWRWVVSTVIAAAAGILGALAGAGGIG